MYLRRFNAISLIGGAGILIALAVAGGLCTGAVSLPISEVLKALLGGGSGAVRDIVLRLRLPRIVLGLLVGASLASSGTAVQALFRNPLAEPGLIGISAGAALGAAMVFTLYPETVIPGKTTWLLPMAAFMGAALCMILIVWLAASEGYTRVSTLLLTGLALNAIAGAGVALLASLATNPALRHLTLWLFGSLDRDSWPAVGMAAPFLLLPTLFLPKRSRSLDALLLGEDQARHLGVPVERLKWEILIVVVVGTGAAVAISGIIGFIGLLVPHLTRLITGPRHALVLPGSAMLGAALLVMADTTARTAFAPAELPVGVITALIGGPGFLFLLLRLRGRSDYL